MQLHKCWIFLVICLPFADFTTWPSVPGCNEEYDAQQCVLKMYCFNSDMWDRSLESFEYLQRNYLQIDFVSSCYYVRDLKVDVYYRQMCDGSDKINAFQSTSERNRIKKFDMNNCNYTPNLSEMNHLYYLDLSHNNFEEAKLYNQAYLYSLTNIDYSYNKINRFDVSGEYLFLNITWLNISHNKLEVLPDATFERFSKLNNLDVSFNYIEKLQMMTFEGIKGLMYLNLSYNNIKDINSSLVRFKELVVLNLSFNNINTIKTEDFMYLQNLKILDISFNSILRIEKTSFEGMPRMNFLNLTHNLVEFVDKDQFLNNNVLTVVDISNNNLNSLPKELFRNKSINCFSIIGNKLTGALVKGIFDGLTLVSDLDISYQLLTSVDDYAFFGISTLQRIILNNNNIRFLSKKSFRTLFNLTYLDLSHNKILEIDFEKDDLVNLRYLSLENNFINQIGHNDFIHLHALSFLNLARNNISKVAQKVFLSLQNLTYFNISNNPLQGIIQENTFNGFYLLLKLDISGTKLTKIYNNSLSGMFQLRELNVSHGFIDTLQYNMFVNTSGIDTIDLSYNKLTTFLLNPTCLLKLTKLLLNNNMLFVISDTTFKGLTYLKKIDVSHNYIQSISKDAFKDQSDLQYLVLSYNYKLLFNISIVKKNPTLNVLLLSGLNNEVNFISDTDILIRSLQLEADGINNISALNLRTFTKVENIGLKYNNISTINTGEFSAVKLLKSLDLSYNKIVYIQPGAFELNYFLLYLNISHNCIKELNYGIFKGLINLKTLDVSFNALYDLKNERFYQLINLDELIVDYNNIDSFNAQDFYGLKLLSIGENPLPCEIFINLKKSFVPFHVTAINIVKHRENVDGITCNKNKNWKPSLNSYNTQLVENSKVLFEIRDELVKISNENKFQTNNGPKNDVDTKYKIDEIAEIFLKQNNEQITQFTNYSAVMVKETSDINILLQKLIKKLNVNEKTTTSLPFAKDNATLNDVMPYIGHIKQELEDLISSEKDSIMQVVNSKLSKMMARIENTQMSKLSPTHQSPKPESLKSVNTLNNVQPNSVFTEVCVGLILFILVGYILYTFYKSKLFIKPRRSSSTRELESANL